MEREWTDELILNLLRWMAWSEPMKFRKKSTVVVEAIRWWPPDDPRHNSDAHRVGCEVGMADIGTITAVLPDRNNRFYSIRTISGWAKLSPGDWIITRPESEHTPRDIYPCKADVFDATYEAIVEE